MFSLRSHLAMPHSPRRSACEERRRFQPGAIMALMRARGMTPAGLSEAAQYPRHILGSWASGVTTPYVESVKKVAAKLGVPWEYFYTPVERSTSNATGAEVADKRELA